MEQMYPGRPFLGFGSGESLNETPAGDDWPSAGGQIERMEEARRKHREEKTRTREKRRRIEKSSEHKKKNRKNKDIKTN